MIQRWIAHARSVKLSNYLIALFAVAIVVPWCVYACLVVNDRDNRIASAQTRLAGLAAAYVEHAATLIRLGVPVPVGGSAGDEASANGANEMARFVRGLGQPDAHFALRRYASLRPSSDDTVIAASADRESAGITADVSVLKAPVLREWRRAALLGAVGVFIRSLLVAAVGLFVVKQLRRRERAETDLAAARRAAESSSRAKSRFLAHMSHELRTPLNAIIGFSELIKTGMWGPLNARYREYAGDIFNSGKHLLQLINEILDLSKLEAGQFELHEESVDLAELVRECLHLVEQQAADAGIELRQTIPPDIRFLRADDRRLRQIVINLLSTAVKFTSEGGQVRVALARRNGGVTLEVSDTGIGMNASDLARALEPFGQVDSALSRKYEGTGLGLPLAKQLVELHGGTLAIRSEPRVGTTVTITLPAERMMERTAQPAAQAV
jgi:signal transduction histidine kinase